MSDDFIIHLPGKGLGETYVPPRTERTDDAHEALFTAYFRNGVVVRGGRLVPFSELYAAGDTPNDG